MTQQHTLYGIVVEFETSTELVEATRKVHQEGYTQIDAYSPFPIEEISEAMERKPTRLPFIVLIGGLIGCFGGFFMQWYAATQSYPQNIGGRPLNSWPMFIPITFELTILVAALAAVLGMLALNGLPQPYHPLFHIEEFSRASQDRFFLCVTSRDPKFDLQKTRELLASVAKFDPIDVPR